MSGKWSGACTYKFVQEYGNHPCLWDPHNSDYKNKSARDDALQQIVDVMQLDAFGIDEARRKIKILRSTYWNERSKILKSKKSGSSNVYKPRSPWFFVANQFLINSPIGRAPKVRSYKKENNEKNMFIPSNETEQMKYIHKQNIKTIQQIIPTPSQPICNTPQQMRHYTQQRRNDIKTNTEPLRPTAIKRYEREPSLTNALHALQEMSISLKQDDEFDVFGKSIALQLKSMPLETALELESEIQAMITQVRLRVIRGSTHPYAEDNSGWISTESNTYLDPSASEQITVQSDLHDEVFERKYNRESDDESDMISVTSTMIQ